jgi:peptide/nickel transport system substrate-binding protein
LPYIDRVRMRTVGNQENAVLAAISGEIDIAQRNFQQLDSLPVLIENEDRGGYKILFWRGSEFTNGTIMRVNMNLLDPNYKELRELLRNKRFRQALSMALDREDMIETLFVGQGTPATYGMNSSSPYWGEEVKEAVQKYAVHAPDRSKEIFRELELRYNGDQLQYGDGTPVTIIIDVNAEWTFAVKVAESIANYWRLVGIDARINPLDRGTGNQRRARGMNHVDLWGPVSGELPLYRTRQEPFYASVLDDRYFGPNRVPEWLDIPTATRPEGGEEYMELYNRIRATGPEGHVEAMKDMAKFQGEWLFTITTAVDLPLMVYRSNRMGNIPDVGISIHDVKFEKPEQFFIKQ